MLACALTCTTNATAQISQDSIQYGGWEKFRIGGYGEMVAAFKGYGNNRFYGATEGNPHERRNTISIPRFVVAGDYKFSKKWILGVEIEFESGGVGTAVEIENTENGEYESEIERGGEVALEQFHITRLIDRALNVRAGHIVVPIGQNNAHHEPVTFFGTVRPEGETTIIPNTWHETGLELFGTLGHKLATFDYQLQVVSGLNAQGFSRNTWAGSARQGIFEEENFTSPGYVARLDWRGVKGLRLGASFYYCVNVAKNSEKAHRYAGYGNMPVRIYNVEGQYKHKWVEARANALWGNLRSSDGLSKANNRPLNNSPYSTLVPIAHKAVAYGGEVGLNLQGIFNNPKFPKIIPFGRFEYYNPQEERINSSIMQQLEKSSTSFTAHNEDRLKTSMWVVGINWRPLPQLVVKADYTHRTIGSGKYNDENEVGIGMAWAGWLWKK